MSDQILDQLIAAWIDGRINEIESEQLQQILLGSPEARERFRALTNLDASLRSFANGDDVSSHAADSIDSRLSLNVAVPVSTTGLASAFWIQVTGALATLAMVGAAYYLGTQGSEANALANRLSQPLIKQVSTDSTNTEQTISGYASLRRAAEIRWSQGTRDYQEGDVLAAGILAFDKGVAEIDFFCGATLIVEGPAKLELISDWSVHLHEGRLRANVPPAAQGFVIKAADSEIIDLGTEFALEVGPENARVKVIDGEIKLRGGDHDGKHLTTGEAQSLRGNDADEGSFKGLSTIGDVQRRYTEEQAERLSNWRDYSNELRKDKRLIAYYPIDESKPDRFVTNATAKGKELDGKIVGAVNQGFGRFGPQSTSLAFDRPGSRVRVRLDGEFEAFTFACWVKIDSLDHNYNALFMADGYENGEPHWQIHEDGRVMFSIMVDDTPGSGMGKLPNARLHRIYYTDPIWDVSKSGQWMHLVAVYNPAAQQVTQYLNGQQISHEKIKEKFQVQTLRIGPAEIGNWGQPFRKLPGFSVRNLNGAIDELAIFKDALNAEEVKKLFAQEKPLGY